MSNVNGEFDDTPTESETTGTVGNFSHGSRETPAPSASPMEADRSEKARGHKPDMHGAGESDSPIVPRKPANKGGVPPPALSGPGGACATPEEEARRDAFFLRTDLHLDRNEPSTGFGMFDCTYLPMAGLMTVTVKIAFNFVDATRPSELPGLLGDLISGGPVGRFFWSATEQADVIQARMSYYPNDLIVIGWTAAFLFDTAEGAASTIDLLRYANTQLVNFRHYDEVLTRVLEGVYDRIETRRGLFARWRLAREAENLNRIRLDIQELTERMDNSIKFLSDMFSARLYKLAAAKIGVSLGAEMSTPSCGSGRWWMGCRPSRRGRRRRCR